MANHLTAFITLRRKLGCQFRDQARILAEFDSFVARSGHDGVPTVELALDFATANPGLASSGHVRRFQLVRQFYDYLATFEPRTSSQSFRPCGTSAACTRTPASRSSSMHAVVG